MSDPKDDVKVLQPVTTHLHIMIFGSYLMLSVGGTSVGPVAPRHGDLCLLCLSDSVGFGWRLFDILRRKKKSLDTGGTST